MLIFLDICVCNHGVWCWLHSYFAGLTHFTDSWLHMSSSTLWHFNSPLGTATRGWREPFHETYGLSRCGWCAPIAVNLAWLPQCLLELPMDGRACFNARKSTIRYQGDIFEGIRAIHCCSPKYGLHVAAEACQQHDQLLLFRQYGCDTAAVCP